MKICYNLGNYENNFLFSKELLVKRTLIILLAF